jgi:hypothetical protein
MLTAFLFPSQPNVSNTHILESCKGRTAGDIPVPHGLFVLFNSTHDSKEDHNGSLHYLQNVKNSFWSAPTNSI